LAVTIAAVAEISIYKTPFSQDLDFYRNVKPDIQATNC